MIEPEVMLLWFVLAQTDANSLRQNLVIPQ
nr:MAG TPA: hypothetical protein [Caudoviricetes sp.]